ncbi:Protein of unknown function [Lactobacillus helveticus CIRM-BIA 103]|nr:Protein of unknown function [Lactobacillus helveticus CIRM-BIA 103]
MRAHIPELLCAAT